MIRIESHDYTLIGVARPGSSASRPAHRPVDPLSMEKEVSPGWNGLDDNSFSRSISSDG